MICTPVCFFLSVLSVAMLRKLAPLPSRSATCITSGSRNSIGMNRRGRPEPPLIRLSDLGPMTMISAGERSMVAVKDLPMPTNMPTSARISRPEKASAITAAM